MRLDKYLKVARIIKRRSIAKEVADNGRVSINQKTAKSSTSVTIGDIIEIRYGNKVLTIEVLNIKDSTKKEDANALYKIIDESYLTQKEG